MLYVRNWLLTLAAFVCLLSLNVAAQGQEKQEKAVLLNGDVTPYRGFPDPLATTFDFTVQYKGDRPNKVTLVVSSGGKRVASEDKLGDKLSSDQLSGKAPITWQRTFPASLSPYTVTYEADTGFGKATPAEGGDFTVWPLWWFALWTIVGVVALILLGRFVFHPLFVRARIKVQAAAVLNAVTCFVLIFWFVWWLFTAAISPIIWIVPLLIWILAAVYAMLNRLRHQ